MYADSITPSMRNAIDETNRRRAKQVAYNEARGIDPQPLRKRIIDITDALAREDADTEALLGSWSPGGGAARGSSPRSGQPARPRGRTLAADELLGLIEDLTAQMHAAAADLQFELAARLRDEVSDLKKELRGMREAGSA
jgi:excinuclease ABC subunit B